MRSISDEKFDQLIQMMQEKGIDLLIVSDSEESPSVNLQYLSGHPNDGMFAVSSSGESCLFPWDMNLAKKHAQVDEILNPSDYGYSYFQALNAFIANHVQNTSPTIGILPSAPYVFSLDLQKQLKDCTVFKEPTLIAQAIGDLRATKTPYELDQLKKVAEITNGVLKDIVKFAQNATPTDTENDLSFLVLKRMRELGAEDNSFPSLVANTDRGAFLHCHPYSTNASFAKPGLSIIDFGAKFNGYCSDVTQPFAFGELSDKQKHMVEISQKAYDQSIEMIDIGVPIHKIAQNASDLLEKAGYPMNYGLGHGIGLSEHDPPFFFPKPTDPHRLEYWREIKIEEGFVFAIEPGAYVAGEGGIRIENNIMIRNGKVEILTNAKIEFIS